MQHNPYEDALRGLGTTRPAMRRPGTQLLNPDEFTQEPLSPGADPAPTDPSILNYLYQNRLKQELQERQFGAARTGDRNEAAALQGLMGQADERIAENPLTRQAAEVDAFRQRRQGAVEQGFGGEVDPIQAMNRYERGIAERKLGVAERVAGIGAGGELAKQEAANRGALAVTESKGAQAQSFLDLMNQASMSGRQVGGITIPGGGGSVRFAPEQQVPPGLLQTVTGARQRLEAEKNKAEWFNKNTEGIQAAQVTLNQAIANALSRDPAPPNLKEYVYAIIQDPTAANHSLDDILRLKGETDVTPEERNMMQQLLTTYRGH